MSDAQTYFIPREVDELFRWPRGRAKRLAIQGLIEHVRLPDGDVRFDRAVIDQILTPKTPARPFGEMRLVASA